MRSEVSGKSGHKQEFILCHETRQTIAAAEANLCEQTQAHVRPGVLVQCEATGRRVLPSLLSTCAVTQKRVLKEMLVQSSISATPLLRDAAVSSSSGQFCMPKEAQTCTWSGRTAHPDDLLACRLTGLPIHIDYLTPQDGPRLRLLAEMLDGMRRTADQEHLWAKLGVRLSYALKGAKCGVEAAVLSPSKQKLATCSESKTMLGLRVQQVGAIYDLDDDAIVGKLARGKRGAAGWSAR